MFVNHRRRADYRGMFSRDDYDSVARFYDGRESTTLRDVTIDSRRVLVKDESSRFGLNAFKVAGVEYAMAKLRLAPGTAGAGGGAGDLRRAGAHLGGPPRLSPGRFIGNRTARRARAGR